MGKIVPSRPYGREISQQLVFYNQIKKIKSMISNSTLANQDKRDLVKDYDF